MSEEEERKINSEEFVRGSKYELTLFRKYC